MNAPVGGYGPVMGRGTGCGECDAADEPRSGLLARCFDSGSVSFTNISKTGGKYADRVSVDTAGFRSRNSGRADIDMVPGRSHRWMADKG